jgi:hypothetical protein
LVDSFFATSFVQIGVVGDVVVVVDAVVVEVFLLEPLGAVAFADLGAVLFEAFGAEDLGAFVVDFGACVFVTVGLGGFVVGLMANAGPALATNAKTTIESQTVVRRMDDLPKTSSSRKVNAARERSFSIENQVLTVAAERYDHRSGERRTGWNFLHRYDVLRFWTTDSKLSRITTTDYADHPPLFFRRPRLCPG